MEPDVLLEGVRSLVGEDRFHLLEVLFISIWDIPNIGIVQLFFYSEVSDGGREGSVPFHSFSVCM